MTAPSATPGTTPDTASAPAAEAAAWSADDAVDRLYAAHWRGLVRLGVLLLGDRSEAEDVAQDAFVALHARWRRLRDPDRALAYLRRTVVNRSRSVLRHRGVVHRHADRERPPDPLPGADRTALEHERRRVVLTALADLPTRQREVLVLRYYLDLAEADIATALGISRGAVKSHASRAAATLRTHLTGVDL